MGIVKKEITEDKDRKIENDMGEGRERKGGKKRDKQK